MNLKEVGLSLWIHFIMLRTGPSGDILWKS